VGDTPITSTAKVGAKAGVLKVAPIYQRCDYKFSYTDAATEVRHVRSLSYEVRAAVGTRAPPRAFLLLESAIRIRVALPSAHFRGSPRNSLMRDGGVAPSILAHDLTTCSLVTAHLAVGRSQTLLSCGMIRGEYAELVYTCARVAVVVTRLDAGSSTERDTSASDCESTTRLHAGAPRPRTAN
jgi:hypothetical protein